VQWMKLFHPKRVYFEPEALDYPLGVKIYADLEKSGVPIKITGSHNRVTGIPGDTPQLSYAEGKQTLVVGVKRDLRLDTCKPSADFEFSIGTGCPGRCQYCYLQTHLGKKPYIRIYVNLEEVFAQITKIVSENLPNTTSFEAASTSDPLAVEHITGSLAQTISFFGKLDHAKLRTVTKFSNIDSLLNITHNQHTKFRFSLNSLEMIRRYEHHTASLAERIAAANQISRAGYPLGFIIAPLFIYPDYKAGYTDLFQRLKASLSPAPAELSFEFITHRFTGSAKKIILERFPQTGLDMEEAGRRRKFGRYGLVKYIYLQEDYAKLQETVLGLAKHYFPQAEVEYFT
jgi:spore photoproduct lyase